MNTTFLPVIGLEVHAELQTRSKMFCSCPVIDPSVAPPNSAVCPVCAGLPGVLPVVNQRAVEYAVRVALALDCRINPTSLFARKNYFYPDLPKGYQISQYESPLAENGLLTLALPGRANKPIRIRRVHLEEDTGKLTHVQEELQAYTLVDLNRAGVPLLEIVSEPDLASIDEVHAYATSLHDVLVCLGVNSGNMSKGVMRFEANVSLRTAGQQQLGTRVEIKNLNSFRAMERAIAYEIQRQAALLDRGLPIRQQTLGWDDAAGVTYTQRGKEEAHDYRYFPEPDLPPLQIDEAWIARARADLPELPMAARQRFESQYSLPASLAALLAQDSRVADYFERAVQSAGSIAPAPLEITPAEIANWITGPLFSYLNETGQSIPHINLPPHALVGLLEQLAHKRINPGTARTVLLEMLQTGQTAESIIAAKNLGQVSDPHAIARAASQVVDEHPAELASYLAGKHSLEHWFFGQAMRRLQGKADPELLRQQLQQLLAHHRSTHS